MGVLVAPRAEAARDFEAAGTDQYLTVASTPITADPVMISCWFNAESGSATQVLAGIYNSSHSDRSLRLGLNSTDQVTFSELSAGAATAATSTTFTAGTWHHAFGCGVSSTSRFAYLNGGGRGSNASSRTIVGANSIAIGRTNNTTPGNYYDGVVAHVAIWNTAGSSDAERDAWAVALAAGAHPYTIARANLVFYAPLNGDGSPEPDLVGGRLLTVSGSPAKIDSLPLRGGFGR